MERTRHLKLASIHKFCRFIYLIHSVSYRICTVDFWSRFISRLVSRIVLTRTEASLFLDRLPNSSVGVTEGGIWKTSSSKLLMHASKMADIACRIEFHSRNSQ